MDLETVFHAEGSSTAEIEALAVKTLLEANGIDVVLVGDSMLPNLPFEVKVRRDQVKRARKLIGETASARALIAERLARPRGAAYHRIPNMIGTISVLLLLVKPWT